MRTRKKIIYCSRALNKDQRVRNHELAKPTCLGLRSLTASYANDIEACEDPAMLMCSYLYAVATDVVLGLTASSSCQIPGHHRKSSHSRAHIIHYWWVSLLVS